MRLSLSVLTLSLCAALVASASAAPQQHAKRVCGTKTPSARELALREDNFLARLQDIARFNSQNKGKPGGGGGGSATFPVVVNVYWHTITNTSGQGAVSAAQINDQLQVLNNAYSGMGFSF